MTFAPFTKRSGTKVLKNEGKQGIGFWLLEALQQPKTKNQKLASSSVNFPSRACKDFVSLAPLFFATRLGKGDTMIRIRLPDTSEAILNAGRWQAQDSRLEQLLNAMRRPWDVSLNSNVLDNDLNEVQVVSKVLGAEIIEQN